jgi:hypothetical protein
MSVNIDFNPTWNPSDTLVFGWTGNTQGGILPVGSGTVSGSAGVGLITGNALVEIVQIPYGQIWPQGN